MNNAGIYNPAPLEDITEGHFHQQVDPNVLDLILTTQEAIKYFNSEGGSIINISSFVITAFNIGMHNELIHLWLKAWCFAFVVAFPAITLVAPLANRLTLQVIKQAQSITTQNEQ